jgi:pyrimidine-nucleoside phosphorylase
MLMSELIAKKRDGGELSAEEIAFVVEGYTAGKIPDYQMSAMLMAIFFRGMTGAETSALTLAMTRSGDTLDLSGISGVTADKHSTGGVGDKTSLVLCPMVCSLGVKIAKMSGRGLGHTGGTIDKLESIPGFSTALTLERFYEIVNSVGFAIAGQTANLDPADKKLYALRDVTGTVERIPLIVSSIMAKKLAAGAEVIVLDVKTGSGAFMKTEEDAFALAREMVAVGRSAGRRTVAVVSDMDEPLGGAVGNALEVKEAIKVLRGEESPRLLELCLTLGANILLEAGKAETEEEATSLLKRSIDDGSALYKLAEFVEAQGGDKRSVFDVSRLPAAPVLAELPSPENGFVDVIDAAGAGRVCLHLGGGRATKESGIDLSVGLVLHAKVGDYVNKGDSLAEIHASSPEKAAEAAELLLACYRFSGDKPARPPFIRGVVR